MPSASPLYTAPVGPPPAELSTTTTALRGSGKPGVTNGAAFHASMVPSSVSKMKRDGPSKPSTLLGFVGSGISNAPVPTNRLATIPVGVPMLLLGGGGGIVTLGSPGNGTASA